MLWIDISSLRCSKHWDTSPADILLPYHDIHFRPFIRLKWSMFLEMRFSLLTITIPPIKTSIIFTGFPEFIKSAWICADFITAELSNSRISIEFNNDFTSAIDFLIFVDRLAP